MTHLAFVHVDVDFKSPTTGEFQSRGCRIADSTQSAASRERPPPALGVTALYGRAWSTEIGAPLIGKVPKPAADA
jgi:hypothetical protein